MHIFLSSSCKNNENLFLFFFYNITHITLYQMYSIDAISYIFFSRSSSISIRWSEFNPRFLTRVSEARRIDLFLGTFPQAWPDLSVYIFFFFFILFSFFYFFLQTHKAFMVWKPHDQRKRWKSRDISKRSTSQLSQSWSHSCLSFSTYLLCNDSNYSVALQKLGEYWDINRKWQRFLLMLYSWYVFMFIWVILMKHEKAIAYFFLFF